MGNELRLKEVNSLCRLASSLPHLPNLSGLTPVDPWTSVKGGLIDGTTPTRLRGTRRRPFRLLRVTGLPYLRPSGISLPPSRGYVSVTPRTHPSGPEWPYVRRHSGGRFGQSQEGSSS